MRTALVAACLAYSFDDNGVLWVRMYDASGYLICVSMLSTQAAGELGEYIMDNVQREDEDEMGEVMGHA